MRPTKLVTKALGDSRRQPPSGTRRLIAEFTRTLSAQQPDLARLEELTERDREVLTLIARGLSDSEGSRQLVLSEQTVKTHVGKIFTKLQLRDRAQAVICVYESGLVTTGSDLRLKRTP